MKLLLSVLCLILALTGISIAKTPKACHKCASACSGAVIDCVDAAVASCPTSPRGKVHRCIRTAKHQCQHQVTSSCVATCKQAGTPVCPTTTTTTEFGATTTSTTQPGGTTTTTLPSHPCTASTPCTSGCFVDNGDGTIHDTCSHLQWEKKDGDDGIQNPADLHDVDNTYMWAGACYGVDYFDPILGCQPNAEAVATCAALEDGGGLYESDPGDPSIETPVPTTSLGCLLCPVGPCVMDFTNQGGPEPVLHKDVTTIWDWLNQVNTENKIGYAGHNDWRIPSEYGRNMDVNLPFPGHNYWLACVQGTPCELETILLPALATPGGDPNHPPQCHPTRW